VFSQPQVEEQFKKFVTVRLHVPPVPEGVPQVPNGPDTEWLRDKKFGNIALPYYVVVRVKGKRLERVGFYDRGVISDPAEFVRFLEETLKVP
jgi:hypothetical protein